jgi:hypothetical protein
MTGRLWQIVEALAVADQTEQLERASRGN